MQDSLQVRCPQGPGVTKNMAWDCGRWAAQPRTLHCPGSAGTER